MKELLKELHKFWTIAHDHPKCDVIHDKMEYMLSKMTDSELVKTLNDCSEEELSEIYPVVENLVEYHNKECAKQFIR
ncbi:MAG: hypothetical protein Q4D26_09720 [Clostridia bacterium]|nr:hypothetical protein [Clostridia bacterium]